MSRFLMITAVVVGLCVVAAEAAEVAQTKVAAVLRTPPVPSRARFRGEPMMTAEAVTMAQPSVMMGAPMSVTHGYAHSMEQPRHSIEAKCYNCGKAFIYSPVVKSYFRGADAPEPTPAPDGFAGQADDFDSAQQQAFRGHGPFAKPNAFRDGEYGHLSRYAKTWNEDQMWCDECLVSVRGKLAGRTMFTAAPTHPGLIGFGVFGGMKTAFHRVPEGERFLRLKTHFDEAEDPPYWPRQYKVEPVYYVPNYNPPTYVTPYQFPNSAHKGKVTSVPALKSYQQ